MDETGPEGTPAPNPDEPVGRAASASAEVVLAPTVPGAGMADGRAEVDSDVAVLAVVTAELDGIEAALGRIDSGAYGRCTACGSPIGDDRLAEDPLTLACAAHC